VLNVLEVAIYMVVVVGQANALPLSYKCVVDGVGGVNCTNGLSAEADGPGRIRFRNGVTAVKDQKGGLSFSHGVTSHYDVTGWVEFSNGISARRDRYGGFRMAMFHRDADKQPVYDAEFYCRKVEVDVAQCDRTR